MRLTVTRLAIAVTLLLLAAPLAPEAQPAGKVPRIGYAVTGLPECKWTPLDEALLQGLRDLGYVPERTIIVDRRCYTRDDELPKVMNEFVRLKVDVIVAGPPVIARAAKNATKDIPIVCASCGDPVDYGLVSSLARPGGNVTGLASLSSELTGKRVALLKEAVPGVSRIAVFIDPDGPGTRTMLKALDMGARALGIETQRIEFRNMADFEKAFRSAAAGGAGAVLMQDNPFVIFGRTEIAKLALKHRLPVAAGFRENADAGALMAYGPSRTDLYRRAASFVDRILKGAKPGDLPVEQPTKFELVINMKTAKALGLTIPPSLLLQADQVLE